MGAPLEKAMSASTYEGIAIDPLYTVSDTQNLRALNHVHSKILSKRSSYVKMVV